MPCLELKVPAQPQSVPATRLRALLEKPGAAILRRNHVAEVPGYESAHLRSRVRICAVLAVNLTDPPEESDPAGAGSGIPEDAPSQGEENESPAPGFAPGLEIWIADGDRAAAIYADADELPGALAMFDAYLRLARFQPAFQRLDQRLVGLHYLFREGLSVGVQGNPAETAPAAEIFFDCIAPIPEIEDFRSPHFVVRLPNEGLGFFHDLLRAASAWLQENSFPNILGAK